MIQRLLMVSISVFVNVDIFVTIGMAFVSVWYLLLQVLPMAIKLPFYVGVHALAIIIFLCIHVRAHLVLTSPK